MKKFRFSTLVVISLLFVNLACTPSQKPKEASQNVSTKENDSKEMIARKWQLVGQQDDKSSQIIMDLVKNGNFQINTVLTDPKFEDAGIGKIQPISHGTWKYDGEKLHLDYIKSDSIKKDDLIVKLITDKELHLSGKNGQNRRYIIYEEK